jgi:hypothetical protein
MSTAKAAGAKEIAPIMRAFLKRDFIISLS